MVNQRPVSIKIVADCQSAE